MQEIKNLSIHWVRSMVPDGNSAVTQEIMYSSAGKMYKAKLSHFYMTITDLKYKPAISLPIKDEKSDKRTPFNVSYKKIVSVSYCAG